MLGVLIIYLISNFILLLSVLGVNFVYIIVSILWVGELIVYFISYWIIFLADLGVNFYYIKLSILFLVHSSFFLINKIFFLLIKLGIFFSVLSIFKFIVFYCNLFLLLSTKLCIKFRYWLAIKFCSDKFYKNNFMCSHLFIYSYFNYMN